MFIRKNQYQALLLRLDTLEQARAALETTTEAMRDESLTLFECFSGLVSDVQADYKALTTRLQPLEEQTEQLQEDRQAERRFIRGANNILNYGVTYGRSKAQQSDR